MIEPRQIRAARALLNWSQSNLAKTSGIALSSIQNIENQVTIGRQDTLTAIQEAFEKVGIEFIPNVGVRLRTESITVLKGSTALSLFFDDVYYSTQKNHSEEILVSGVEEAAYDNADQNLVDKHLSRMKIAGAKSKVLCRRGDSYFTTPYAEYRWVDPVYFAGTPFYVYDDKLAILLWQPELQVIILQYPQMVDAYRKQFFSQWNNAEIPPAKTLARVIGA